MGLKKYGKYIIFCFFCLFLCTSCKNVNQKDLTENEVKNSTSSNTDKEYIFTNRQEKIFEDGYDIDGYRILLTEKQRESTIEKKMFVRNNYFETDFRKRENLIDETKKINTIIYAMSYDPETESYSLGLFIINTSDITIDKMKFKMNVRFKDVDEELNDDVYLEDDDFVQLPPKGFIGQTVSGNVPAELKDTILSNTIDDIKIDISDLEINGEKMENTNEN